MFHAFILHFYACAFLSLSVYAALVASALLLRLTAILHAAVINCQETKTKQQTQAASGEHYGALIHLAAFVLT